jgi:glutamine amidotransferase
MPFKVYIVDYDAGNLRNVQKAIEFLGFCAEITDDARDVADAQCIVLPGVGAFKDGMAMLKNKGLDLAIQDAVLQEARPILGICLGMQLLAEAGYEGEYTQGLGLLPMVVERMNAEKEGLRLPHIGWNDIMATPGSVLFSGVPEDPDFYFVHSYHAVCKNRDIVAATAEYGQTFVAAVEWKNIFGTQFHPEKSQRYGLQIIKNFLVHASASDAGS